MNTEKVNKLIGSIFRATDQLSDQLAGTTGFPLAMLIDQTLFTLQGILADNEALDTEVELMRLEGDAHKRIADVLQRLERNR